MDDKPLISVVMPTFNRAHILPRAIKSVLDQTYTHFELIIIDDNSPDKTKEVTESFKDQRIRYHNRTDYHGNIGEGVLAAKNRGFDLAEGSVIVGVDDDDELLPYALETAINELKRLSKQSVKIIWFESMNAESGKIAGKHWDHECEVTFQDLLCEKFSGDYWVVFCSDAIADQRFDERLWASEGFLWIKLHRKNKGFYIPKLLYKQYRQHGVRICTTSTLNQLSRIILTQQIFLDDFGDDLKKLCPKRYIKTLGSLGINQVLNNQMSDGRENLRKSLKFEFSIIYFSFYLLQFILPKQYLINLYKCVSEILSIK
jgi:glycosyltransferase involved in cell wall biosynthesis